MTCLIRELPDSFQMFTPYVYYVLSDDFDLNYPLEFSVLSFAVVQQTTVQQW